jgi:hypothetical protein
MALTLSVLMLGVAAGRLAPAGCDDAPKVQVTVVVVLATSANKTVSPKLRDLAKEVQKRNPGLTGFALHETVSKSIPVGESASIALIDKQELQVTVERPKDDEGRVCLTIRPPGLGACTYACACDKFFPVVTPYTTAAGERLILAVMGKPCAAKPEKK